MTTQPNAVNLTDAELAVIQDNLDAMSDREMQRVIASLGADLAEGAELAEEDLALIEMAKPRMESILEARREAIKQMSRS